MTTTTRRTRTLWQSWRVSKCWKCIEGCGYNFDNCIFLGCEPDSSKPEGDLKGKAKILDHDELNEILAEEVKELHVDGRGGEEDDSDDDYDEEDLHPLAELVGK